MTSSAGPRPAPARPPLLGARARRRAQGRRRPRSSRPRRARRHPRATRWRSALLAQEAMLDNRVDETVERAERAIEAAERHDLPGGAARGAGRQGQRARSAGGSSIEENIDLPAPAWPRTPTAIGEHLIASRALHNVAFLRPRAGSPPPSGWSCSSACARPPAGPAGTSSRASPTSRGASSWPGPRATWPRWCAGLDDGRRRRRGRRLVGGWTYLRTIQLHLERERGRPRRRPRRRHPGHERRAGRDRRRCSAGGRARVRPDGRGRASTSAELAGARRPTTASTPISRGACWCRAPSTPA